MKHVTIERKDFATPVNTNRAIDHNIRVERLEAALDRLAYLLDDDAIYSPLYDRLEADLEELTDPRAHLTAAQIKAEERRSRRTLAA